METVMVAWISVDMALLAERRTGPSGSVSAWALLARDGRGAESEHENPEAFYFRVLDAMHHAHRILIIGGDGARVRLGELASRYSFLARRIVGVRYEPEGTASAVARHLIGACGGESPEAMPRGATGDADEGSFRVEPRSRPRHDEAVENHVLVTGAAR
jgi:hypothetical protein